MGEECSLCDWLESSNFGTRGSDGQERVIERDNLVLSVTLLPEAVTEIAKDAEQQIWNKVFLSQL